MNNMKKIFTTITLALISVSSFAYSVETKKDTVTIWMDTTYESLETQMTNVIKDAGNAKKVIVKYDGKWKYVFKGTEALVATEVMMDVSNNAKETIKELKKNKLLVQVR